MSGGKHSHRARGRGDEEKSNSFAARARAVGSWWRLPDTSPLITGNPVTTSFIELRRATARNHGRPFVLNWSWRPLHEISANLATAVIYREDYSFFCHRGLDRIAIMDAVRKNIEHRAVVAGGSTITQQLAKNLYLQPSRTFSRKAREARITLSLEKRLTKLRILELYLNIVEWGDGIFGAEAAALHWFDLPADELNLSQSIRLAIALPNPRQRSPETRTPEATEDAIRIIRRMHEDGVVDSDGQERLLGEFALCDNGPEGESRSQSELEQQLSY